MSGNNNVPRGQNNNNNISNNNANASANANRNNNGNNANPNPFFNQTANAVANANSSSALYHHQGYGRGRDMASAAGLPYDAHQSEFAHDAPADHPRAPILEIPPEIINQIFEFLGPVASTCISVINKFFYKVHRSVHGKTSLSMKASADSDSLQLHELLECWKGGGSYFVYSQIDNKFRYLEEILRTLRKALEKDLDDDNRVVVALALLKEEYKDMIEHSFNRGIYTTAHINAFKVRLDEIDSARTSVNAQLDLILSTWDFSTKRVEKSRNEEYPSLAESGGVLEKRKQKMVLERTPYMTITKGGRSSKQWMQINLSAPTNETVANYDKWKRELRVRGLMTSIENDAPMIEYEELVRQNNREPTSRSDPEDGKQGNEEWIAEPWPDMDVDDSDEESVVRDDEVRRP